jgi:type II secretory pathway pseudopilin PulG
VSLLEALVALVVLGLTGVGFLEAFQGASRSARDAAAWTTAVAYAESGMEEATLGAASAEPGRGTLVDTLPGFRREVAVRPWRGGVDEVAVTVTLPSGARCTLRRLAARRAPVPR